MVLPTAWKSQVHRMDLLTGARAIDCHSQILRHWRRWAKSQIRRTSKLKSSACEYLSVLWPQTFQPFKFLQCNEGSALNGRASPPQKANCKMTLQLLEKTPKLCSGCSGYIMKTVEKSIGIDIQRTIISSLADLVLQMAHQETQSGQTCTFNRVEI